MTYNVLSGTSSLYAATFFRWPNGSHFFYFEFAVPPQLLVSCLDTFLTCAVCTLFTCLNLLILSDTESMKVCCAGILESMWVCGQCSEADIPDVPDVEWLVTLFGSAVFNTLGRSTPQVPGNILVDRVHTSEN